MPEPVERFSSRADVYDRWRPGYPAGIVDLLALPAGAVLADVGCGTGKLARPFLERGHAVVGVEPNAAMRAACPLDHPRFRLVGGRAEATGLPSSSVDAIVCGQAFHWFEPGSTRVEWERILRGPGRVALVWNDRRNASSPLLAEYEELLRRHCPGYGERLRQAPAPRELAAFFAPAAMVEHVLHHEQALDAEGLAGRALSASYVPREGQAHEALFAGLRRAFDRHQAGGRVVLPYDTRVFLGRLSR